MGTEKRTLSKREKMLVFGGGTIGIFILMFMYVITPLSEQLETKTAELDDISMRWRMIESALANEAAIRESLEEAFDQYYVIRDAYLSEAMNQEIGRELTFMVRDHNFQEISQSISEIANFTEGGITGNPAFSIQPISMTLGGGFEELQWILDTMEEMPSTSITNFSLSLGGAEGDMIDGVSLSFRIMMFRRDFIESELERIRPTPVEDEADEDV